MKKSYWYLFRCNVIETLAWLVCFIIIVIVIVNIIVIITLIY